MPINIPTQQLLSDGDRWFAYSGTVQGDVTVPATVSLITIANTGLRDSLIYIHPFEGQPIGAGGLEALGTAVNIDDIEVWNNQRFDPNDAYANTEICLMIPRQSKLEILSLNTSTNNTQNRGANVIGYFL